MTELANQLAYWIPIAMIGYVLPWGMAKLFGWGGGPGRYTLNTWPFALVLLGGAFFGLIAGINEFAFGDNPWIRIPIFIVGGIVTFELVPRVWEYLVPPASPSGQLGGNNAHEDE